LFAPLQIKCERLHEYYTIYLEFQKVTLIPI